MNTQPLPQETPPAAPLQQPSVLWVIDPNVKPGKTRTHTMKDPETMEDVPYTFYPNKPIPVPFDHAMKFLQVNFRVAGDEMMTKELVPTRPAAYGHEGQKVENLDPDEVVARLDELTRPALAKRAAGLPGAAQLRNALLKMDRDQLIAFIMGEIEKIEAPKKMVERDDLIPGDGVGYDDTMKLHEEHLADELI